MISKRFAILLAALLAVATATAQSDAPTGEIAYTSYGGEIDRIILMDADGSNPRALTDGERDAFLPIWSPDGEKLVYFENTTEQPLSERPPLRLMMNADGSNPVEIAVEPEGTFIMNPAWYLDWSPDSQHFFYMTYTEDAEPAIRIFMVDAATASIEEVLQDEGTPNISFTRFFGNEHLIVYRTDGIYETALDGTELTLLTDSHYPPFAVAPDRKTLAFVDARNLLLFNPSANTQRTILEAMPGRAIGQQVLYAHSMQWSPDGEYLSGAVELYAASIPANPEPTPLAPEDQMAVFTVRSDGSDYHILDTSDYMLTWSPDSQWVAYNVLDADGSYQIAVSRPNGTEQTVLTSEGQNSQPAWRPVAP